MTIVEMLTDQNNQIAYAYYVILHPTVYSTVHPTVQPPVTIHGLFSSGDFMHCVHEITHECT